MALTLSIYESTLFLKTTSIFFNPIFFIHQQGGFNQGLGNPQILLLLVHTDPIFTACITLSPFGHWERHPLLVVEPRKERIGIKLTKHLFIVSSRRHGTCQDKCINLFFITARSTWISRQQPSNLQSKIKAVGILYQAFRYGFTTISLCQQRGWTGACNRLFNLFELYLWAVNCNYSNRGNAS